MAAACNLLSAHPDKTVREVALAVAAGYRLPTQFAKAFRREVGMSPSAFSAKVPEVRAHMTREQYSRSHAVFADPGQSSLGLRGEVRARAALPRPRALMRQPGGAQRLPQRLLTQHDP